MPSEKLDQIPLSVQKQIEADGGNAMREQWKEAADDLNPQPSTSVVLVNYNFN